MDFDSLRQTILKRSKRRVAEDRPVYQSTGRRDCYWLYVVTSCKSEAILQEPIKNPARFPWHEVKKVDHYYLSVDALTQPMQVREAQPPSYGDKPSCFILLTVRI